MGLSMTRLPWPLLERLAQALGIEAARPRPLSDRTVEIILHKWVELRDASRGHASIPTPLSPEPGKLHLACTIAAKVARCPHHTFPAEVVPWMAPAVEVVALISPAITEETNELEGRRQNARRAGTRLPAGREAALIAARRILRDLRRSKQYRQGIEYLAQAFAECLADDPAFREVVSRWTRNGA